MLDSRIATRHYGKIFLESLPPYRTTRKIADVEAFFDDEES
jgi:ATP-dependent DNA helicase DinG